MPDAQNDFLAPHVALLLRCCHALTGRDLVAPDLPPVEQARQVWLAPFALVSHHHADDPVFNYGNQTALRLFALPWDEFTRLPSRLSAQTPDQAERARLLALVQAQGYIDDYRGVRIARTGRRFWIENATVWTLTNADGSPGGQAAMFARWQDIDELTSSIEVR